MLRFWSEWYLAVNRAFWFPILWALGLEQPPVEVPMQIGIEIASTTAPLPAPVVAISEARGRPSKGAGRRSNSRCA